jgi:protein-disulfide isomerase
MTVLVHYNVRVQKAFLVLALAPLLMGGACEKKTAKAGDDPKPALEEPKTAVDDSPLQGVDLGKLDNEKQKTFNRLAGSLSSPCGKAESLRRSFMNDTSCKRAAFAVRYLVALLEDDASAKQAEDEYNRKYKTPELVKLDVSHAPRTGTEDAPIKLVEFYDYGCPHCKLFTPVMEQVVNEREGRVVEYFMQYPLEKHPDSKSAAAGALAANAQGKFKEMHELLFDKSPDHNREHVMEYAKQLGLDIGKFERDYTAALAQVQSDQKQGEAAGVDSTPTLFFNGRKYEGPMHKKYIEMWVDEELAVNR